MGLFIKDGRRPQVALIIVKFINNQAIFSYRMNVKTLKEFDFNNKRVLVRFDYNVPMENGIVQNDKRIKASLPTINYLLEKKAKIIIMTSAGRPKGKVVEELRTTDIAKKLSLLLGKEVKKANDCIGSEVEQSVAELNPGDILLLENLRFHPEEEKNDEEFAKSLAKLGDIYVNDAFANSHREHASMHAITKFLPGCVGLLVEKELSTILNAVENPERPFVVLIGGAKLETKIPIIKKMLEKADKVLVGGAMMFSFYKARGLEVGKSKFEAEFVDIAKELLEEDKLLLPTDVVVASEVSEDAESETVSYDNMPTDKMGLDVGPDTVRVFSEELKKAKTIMWNGPMGVFEIEKFAIATNELGKVIADIDAVKIVGGGDSVAAIERAGLEDKFTLVSTGGGASLKLIEKGTLPALKALEDQ